MDFKEIRLQYIILCCTLSLLHHVASATKFNESLTATANAHYLSSPGYPSLYPNNLTYEWLITSSSSKEVVKIEVTDCEIEYVAAKIPFCQIDKLTIYDGPFPNATVLYDSCCMTAVPAMNSSGSSLLIKFVTDSTVVARGFQIKYYNTAYIPDTVSSASLVAIVVLIIPISLVVAGVAFYIYKTKKSKDPRINPVGGEDASTSGQFRTHTKQFINEYEKPPLPADSPVPPPHEWTAVEGMKAPEITGPLARPDILNDPNLPDGTSRANQLPPLEA